MEPRRDARTSLSTWSLTGPASAAGTCCFPASLPVFAGHFPGRPLVPGVYLLAAVAELAGRALGRPLTILQIERAKWSAPALPDTVLTLQVAWSDLPGGLQLDGTVHAGETVAASCRLVVER